MGVLNPQFYFSLEHDLQVRAENEYARYLSSGNLWWNKVARLIPSNAATEVVAWVVNNAILEGTKLDPSVRERPMTILETSFQNEYQSSSITLQRAQFEDIDGRGVNLIADWTSQMSYQSVYYPQRVVAKLLADGYTNTGYDGVNFFSQLHPVDGKNSATTYCNVFTGNAGNAPSTDPNASLYPGAIDVRIGTGSVTIASAYASLQKAFAYIASQKGANGTDPRFLRPAGIIAGPDLYPYLSNILNAQFISMSSGTTDIRGEMQALGFGNLILSMETSGVFYIVADGMESSQMGGIVYVEREPVAIKFHWPQEDVVLDRADRIEGIARGRSVGGYGHPYYIYECRVS